ncbi:sensor histidine kinase [Nocardia sp. NRRL S-836]|uniref:sensor histidine kinase n=1 Tax=Nocardia sp. NRRL S-836 TaxID=1519492 RepID=UPI0012F9EF77|nr:histidine kinase [Nocardia sp. NRRL S-836]
MQPLFSRRSARLRLPALALQAALVFLPALLIGHVWVAAGGILAGNGLRTLSDRTRWLAFGATVLTAGAAQAWRGGLATTAFAVVSTATTGLVLHGFARMTAARATGRGEHTRAAVAAERLRVSRDLHDLLGYGLSAIQVKSELAHKLVLKDPEGAQGELAEILAIVGCTLADVRTIARGYQPLSLAEASDSAKALLAAAEIEAVVRLDHGPLPEPVETVLAAVLREGITNVLRHSKAGNCRVAVCDRARHVELDIWNDGVVEGGGRAGSGVGNMAGRVEHLGGRLRAAQLGADWFHLHVSVPLDLV